MVHSPIIDLWGIDTFNYRENIMTTCCVPRSTLKISPNNSKNSLNNNKISQITKYSTKSMFKNKKYIKIKTPNYSDS